MKEEGTGEGDERGEERRQEMWKKIEIGESVVKYRYFCTVGAAHTQNTTPHTHAQYSPVL